MLGCSHVQRRPLLLLLLAQTQATCFGETDKIAILANKHSFDFEHKICHAQLIFCLIKYNLEFFRCGVVLSAATPTTLLEARLSWIQFYFDKTYSIIGHIMNKTYL